MSSSLVLPRGMETLFPSPEISRYYNKANQPYTNTAQVVSEVLVGVRYVGQTFLIGTVEWCFKEGTTNNDLVVKNGTTNENKLVYIAGLTLASNVITLTAASIWKFGSTEYTNASNLTITIPAATTGFKRVDRILLGKNNNTLFLLEGVQSSTRAYPKEYNTQEFIELTFVNVDGGAIAPIAPPILGDTFVSKAQQGFLGVGAGPIISISEKENYIITSGRTEIQHISNYSTNSPLYDGREVYIFNQQSTAVTLYNKLADGGNPLLLQMAFPSDQDYILQPKTGVKLKWSQLLNLWLFVSSGNFDGLYKETLITTGGNKNNEPTPTKVLRFSNT